MSLIWRLENDRRTVRVWRKLSVNDKQRFNIEAVVTDEFSNGELVSFHVRQILAKPPTYKAVRITSIVCLHPTTWFVAACAPLLSWEIVHDAR